MAKIMKKWLDSPKSLREWGQPVDWFETTEDECLRHTEGAGYWEPGTVLPMLEDGGTVHTPSAQYRMEK